jgi:probable HAF family extracellular repeat protein
MIPKHLSKPLCALSGLAVLAFGAATAQAQTTTYSLTDIGAIPSVPTGEPMVSPNGINNAGQVVGSTAFHIVLYSGGAVANLGTLPGGGTATGLAINATGDISAASGYESDLGNNQHAALFRNDGTEVNLGVLIGWGTYSYGYGINDSQQIVGSSGLIAPSTNTAAFIWDATNGFTDLGTLGGQYAQAHSVNNAGLVTGSSQISTGSGPFHAFLWDKTNGMQDIGTIAGDSSSGVFINQNGHVVGNSTINTVDSRTHAFRYDGTLHDLGSLGAGSTLSDISSAFSININDDVVGTTYRPYTGGALYQTAFVYHDGVMSELENMVDASGVGYRLLTATGINDAGQIIVQATKVSTGATTAVLLTPTTAATDSVTITAATYNTRRKSLQVQATDSNPAATLQAFITSSDTLIGSLTKKPRGYSGKFSLATNPANITVKSSLGGSATAAVTAR